MGLDIYFIKKSEREIGYFRKVNFLVKFFEDRGFDTPNQTPLRISKEDAKELLRRCEEVLKNHSLAETLLPTMGGFLFGDTDYNDDYFKSVKEVADYVRDVLLPEFDKAESNEEIYFGTWY